MLKKSLRETYSTKRSSLTTERLTSDSISIANKLLELPIWHFDYYHLFLSITTKKEVDTSSIISILQGKDKHVIVPKVIDSHTLNHFLLTDNTKCILSKWDVPEPLDGISISPKKLDVVFVPLLAFDVYGNRVGYGKGFYDGFLSQCRRDAIKVGVSLFEAENKITDVHYTDVKLNYCVTPNQVYSFDAS